MGVVIALVLTLAQASAWASHDLDYDKEVTHVAKGGECVKECQQRQREKIEICNDLFNSKGSAYYRDTAWHKTCLANARSEFDSCRSTC